MPSNDLTSIAKSKATANRLAKALSIPELKKAIDHLQAALTGIQKRDAAKAAKKQEADLKKLKAMMAKMGLSDADVRALVASKTKRKAESPRRAVKRKTGARRRIKVAPKYRLKVGRETHTWTGRGRMPLVFKDFVGKGGSLDSCLIKK